MKRAAGRWSDTLLSRIEDAGLNASAPPQQRWLDGWLVRFSPGKAQRARCINAVAEGRRALADKLAEVEPLYRERGLPLLVRITPFTQPSGLDMALAALGFQGHDDTRVMACLNPARPSPDLPSGLRWDELPPPAFAAAVGSLRGSPAGQCAAHAERLAALPVPCLGYAIRRDGDGAVLACGQVAHEGRVAGLYDIVTAPASRRNGLGTLLCERLLSISASRGASVLYLQVSADNDAARRIYGRLGFADAYSYHYRLSPPPR